jgi:hypothetical protein
VLNGKFYVRKCVVRRKEKIMGVSYGETSGFVPIAGEELEKVNGGGINLYILGVYVGTISPVAGAAIIAGAVALTVGAAVVSSSNKSK